MNRREVLAAAGSGMVVGLAGCGSNGEDPTSADPSGEESDVDISPPQANLPDGWELQTPDTESHVLLEGSRYGVNYTAIGHTRRYEDKALRERIQQELFDRFDRPLVVGFATHVELDVLGGGLTESIILNATDRIQKQAESGFRSRVGEYGISNFSKEGTYQAPGSHSPSEFQTFSGAYDVESVEISGVDIPNVEEENFTLESGELEVSGLLATHRQDEAILITGGVYPADNYIRSKEWDITGGVHLDLTVDLGLRPTLHRGDVVNFARGVHL